MAPISPHQRQRIIRAASVFPASRPELGEFNIRFYVILVSPLRPRVHRATLRMPAEKANDSESWALLLKSDIHSRGDSELPFEIFF